MNPSKIDFPRRGLMRFIERRPKQSNRCVSSSKNKPCVAQITSGSSSITSTLQVCDFIPLTLHPDQNLAPALDYREKSSRYNLPEPSAPKSLHKVPLEGEVCFILSVLKWKADREDLNQSSSSELSLLSSAVMAANLTQRLTTDHRVPFLPQWIIIYRTE